MKVTHPYAGIVKGLVVDGKLLEFVSKLTPDLPTTGYKARTKSSWQGRGLAVQDPKTGEMLKPGVVPEGDYTDPSTERAKKAVFDLYKFLGGQPVSRSRIAVALNFQMSDEVDKVRKLLAEDGVVGTDIDPGARGRSVRWIGEGAVAPEPAKRASKKATEAPAENVAPITGAKKAPTKAAGKPATAKKGSTAPAGSRPAKRAAKAAEAEAKLAAPVEEPVA